MTILIAGANGQVGHEISKQAGTTSHPLVCTKKDQMDITNRESVSTFFEQTNPALVINAAAYTAVDRAEQETDLAFKINQVGTANLAHACANQGIPLIHLSTDYVFDGLKSSPYTETDTTGPCSEYGKSKLEGENEIARICTNYHIFRLSWVFAARGNNFVHTMLRLAKEGKTEIRVVDDQIGGPTWAGDIATLLLKFGNRVLSDSPPSSGIYHYTGRPFVSWYEFAVTIFDYAETNELISTKPKVIPISTAEYPTPAARPANSRLETEHMDINELSPPDWRAGLKHVLEELKNK